MKAQSIWQLRETDNRLKAAWHSLRGYKVLFRARPRIVIKKDDQEMFMAVMSGRIEVEDTALLIMEGNFVVPPGEYVVPTILVGEGVTLRGLDSNPSIIREQVVYEAKGEE